jgi:hypothetical protein
VLVVVRDAAANPTHPNVVSVPTQRIPLQLYDAIIASGRFVGEEPDRHAAFFDGGVISSADSGHDATVHATEALLARKLGLADRLESGLVRFRAALRARVDGTAVYDNLGGDAIFEPISMLNVVVAIDSAQDEIPLMTTSYSLLAWTSVAQFVRGVDARAAHVVSPALDSIELCVHGVCLDAARASLMQLVGRMPLGSTRVEPWAAMSSAPDAPGPRDRPRA